MPIREHVRRITETTIYSSSMGLLALGIMELSTRLDKLVNPQIIEALKNNTHWWQYFTTTHSLTNLYLTNEPWSAVVAFAIPTLISFGALVLDRR